MKNISSLLVMLSVGLVFTSCASRDFHPHFKNEVDAKTKTEVLSRQWTYSIEPVSSSLKIPSMEYVSPVLFENSLVFGSNRFGLISLYPKILREKWKLPVQNGVVSPIEADANRAFFTGGDGNLYAISLETGKEIWNYPLRNPVSSKPTVKDKDLYIVTSDDSLVSLESDTGKWQWSYRRRNVSGPTIHGASKPLVVGDTVWVGFADGALVALSRNGGKVLWEKQLNTGKRFGSVNAEFLLHDHRVYVPAYDGALYVLDEKTGSTIWARDSMGGSKKVTLKDDVVYAPSSNGVLYALDAKTGKDLWKFELDNGIPSDVAVLAHHIVVASSSEYLYAIDKSNGKLSYRYQVGYGSGFSGGLTIDPVRNWIYVLSRGGNLMAFNYNR
jgi:outer membrane protein assembly factor BamB